MNTKELLQPYLDKAKSELFTSLVDQVMKEHFLTPPPNILEPKEIWEQKKRNELIELFSGQAAIDKTARGFDAIIENLNSLLSPQEMEKVSQEWERGVENWIAETKIVQENATPKGSLMKIMGLSEELFVKFYQAANRYFEYKDFQKASDAFYAIAGLDPSRYNVWMALGLSEAHNQRYEQALISFSLASLIDAGSPHPYIFSAECCLKENRREEAKIYVELAEEAVNHSTLKDKQSLLASIQNLKQL